MLGTFLLEFGHLDPTFRDRALGISGQLYLHYLYLIMPTIPQG
jgi:hypothetical protein